MTYLCFLQRKRKSVFAAPTSEVDWWLVVVRRFSRTRSLDEETSTSSCETVVHRFTGASGRTLHFHEHRLENSERFKWTLLPRKKPYIVQLQ